MPLIENTASSGYVDKESTNIRLEREVKERVLQEASEKATTMTDVINTILKEHYKSED
jgi:antitoxin component of RelBE/YafQ-DinJ toxin-antitoxin module